MYVEVRELKVRNLLGFRLTGTRPSSRYMRIRYNAHIHEIRRRVRLTFVAVEKK